MPKTQAEIEKELFNHGSMSSWKKDEDGNIYMVNRQSDNVTTSGITIDKYGNITKTK